MSAVLSDDVVVPLMVAFVCTMRHHAKIFYSVIVFAPVDVMDDLTRNKFTAERFLSNHAMLEYLSPIGTNSRNYVIAALRTPPSTERTECFIHRSLKSADLPIEEVGSVKKENGDC